jgi:hypothetical protein
MVADHRTKLFMPTTNHIAPGAPGSLADIHERKFWKHYMKAYENCLSATSTRRAPWFVAPTDDKENA